MNADLFARYVSRIRREAAGHYSVNIEVPYMVGRKLQAAGRHWSNAHRLTYRAQRLARLGYLDGARGLPVRPIARGAGPKDCLVAPGKSHLGLTLPSPP